MVSHVLSLLGEIYVPEVHVRRPLIGKVDSFLSCQKGVSEMVHLDLEWTADIYIFLLHSYFNSPVFLVQSLQTASTQDSASAFSGTPTCNRWWEYRFAARGQAWLGAGRTEVTGRVMIDSKRPASGWGLSRPRSNSKGQLGGQNQMKAWYHRHL